MSHVLVVHVVAVAAAVAVVAVVAVAPVVAVVAVVAALAIVAVVAVVAALPVPAVIASSWRSRSFRVLSRSCFVVLSFHKHPLSRKSVSLFLWSFLSPPSPFSQLFWVGRREGNFVWESGGGGGRGGGGGQVALSRN